MPRHRIYVCGCVSVKININQMAELQYQAAKIQLHTPSSVNALHPCTRLHPMLSLLTPIPEPYDFLSEDAQHRQQLCLLSVLDSLRMPVSLRNAELSRDALCLCTSTQCGYQMQCDTLHHSIDCMHMYMCM